LATWTRDSHPRRTPSSGRPPGHGNAGPRDPLPGPSCGQTGRFSHPSNDNALPTAAPDRLRHRVNGRRYRQSAFDIQTSRPQRNDFAWAVERDAT
jgi:hypothetical protein